MLQRSTLCNLSPCTFTYTYIHACIHTHILTHTHTTAEILAKSRTRRRCTSRKDGQQGHTGWRRPRRPQHPSDRLSGKTVPNGSLCHATKKPTKGQRGRLTATTVALQQCRSSIRDAPRTTLRRLATLRIRQLRLRAWCRVRRRTVDVVADMQ